MSDTTSAIMSQEELRKLQLIELELLLEIDRICRKNNIKYFLAAGSLLGAVRHKGFIPWDDDADTYMMRDEYERFCKACEKDLDTEKYFLQNADTDREYRWEYAKLRRKDTLYLRAGQEAIKCMSGVSVDIFVMDRFPNSEIHEQLQNIKRRACIKTLWSVIGVTEDPSPFKRGLYRVIRHIPKQIPLGVINRMGRRNNRHSEYEYICCLGFYRNDGFLNGARRHLGYNAKLFDECTEVEFEGFKFLAPVGYMEYLQGKYKNMWEYPPESQRLVHPPKEFNYDVEVNLRGRDIDEYMNHKYIFLTKEEFEKGVQ